MNSFDDTIIPETEETINNISQNKEEKEIQAQNQIKLNTKSLIKVSLIELLRESTTHGLSNIFRTKKLILKLMWTIFFLISAGYCSYMIHNSISDYLSYNVITNFQTVFELPSLFPTVTICNLNAFQTNFSIQFAKKFYNETSKPEEFITLWQEIYKLDDNLKHFFSYPLNESLIECQFNGYICSAGQFEWMFDPMFGNCFRFNSGIDFNGKPQNLSYVSRAGTLYGKIA